MKKFLLVVSFIMSIGALFAQSSQFDQEADKIISQMTFKEKVSQMVNNSVGIERLGIKPYNWWNEALHGVGRAGRATVFPQSIGLAATFDKEIIKELADAISDEARAKFNAAQKRGNYLRYTGLTFWSPNVNIFRDPRWGRGHETYGEDPYLSGQIGVAFVKGLQGDDDKFLKTSACAKHYAVHSGPEALRHEFDACPTQKDLFETYLPAFETLVRDAKVESIMSAYNRVNGASASAHEYLFKDILRGEWGFEGHIVSDCGAVRDIYTSHKIKKDAAEAAALAVKTGLNLNCGDTYSNLVEALSRELVTEEDIDAALKPLIITKLKLGLLGDNSENPYNKISVDVIACDEHRDIARRVAVKSMVLLSNKNNVLPLRKDLFTIAVAGPYATDNYVLLGNYYGVSNNMTSFLEGIVDKVSACTRIHFAPGITASVPNINPDAKGNYAQTGDATILTLGLSPIHEGEGSEAMMSAQGDKLSLDLPKHQIEFLKRTRAASDKPLIVVLTGGSPMNIKEITEIADAVILAWYPGQEGGGALADIIFGDVSPSGRLPITFPVDESQLPDFKDYSMKGRTYRYMTQKPMYTFGYGLSYTTFAYSNMKVVVDNAKKIGDLTITADITNSGKRTSEEVVQLYLALPGAGATNPISTMCGFERIELAPNETKSVSFTLSAEQLMEITVDGTKNLATGDYTLLVGNCSPSERSEELNGQWLEAKFNINKRDRFKLITE